MAGESSRFFESGYKVPKYKLVLNQKSILENVLLGFKEYFNNDVFVFGLNPKFNDVHFVKSICQKIRIKKYKIIELKSQSRGQADTVNIILNSLKDISENEELYIFNVDTIHLNFKKQNLTQMKCRGYLELFVGKGDHWSFAKLKSKSDVITRMAEKERISNYCSNGLYYFSDVKLYKYYFNIYKKTNQKELYIAPMYNFLIKDRITVKGIVLNDNDFKFCGTPKEYEILSEQDVYL